MWLLFRLLHIQFPKSHDDAAVDDIKGYGSGLRVRVKVRVTTGISSLDQRLILGFSSFER